MRCCRIFALLAVSAVFAACSRDHAEARTPLPAAPLASAAEPSAATTTQAPMSSAAPAQPTLQPPSGSAAPAIVAAWTDPPIIEALARDCKFQPPAPSPNELEPSPLSCGSGLYEQSCAIDPCYSTDQRQCKPRCEKACNTCSDRCASACTQCKASCSDDACRRSCAETCASCKQACLGEKDRCASGKCAAEYKSCTEQLSKRWKQSGCAKACDAHQECEAKCQDAPGCGSTNDDTACEKCTARCTATLKRSCPPDLAEICLFNGGGPSDAP